MLFRSYEALMVTQFKDNKFEQEFYSAEKGIKTSIYYRTYCIPELQSLMRESYVLTQSGGNTGKVLQNLRIVNTEIDKMCKNLSLKVPAFNQKLFTNYVRPGFIQKVDSFLGQVDFRYSLLYNEAVKERDVRYGNWVKKLGSHDNFIAFRQKYYNSQITSVVTNEKELQEFSMHEDELVPAKYAIYRNPLSDCGRAHFYSPSKVILGVFIDTFWFNLSIIWMFGGVLFLILYYDLLRRVITYFETLRLNRANQRRLMRLLNITEPSKTVPKS